MKFLICTFLVALILFCRAEFLGGFITSNPQYGYSGHNSHPMSDGYCQFRGGAGRNIVITRYETTASQSALNRGTVEYAEPKKTYGESAKNSAVKIPSSCDREFPQFGRWIDSDGNVVEYNDYCYLRPAEERLADYFHYCLDRNPQREVSNQDMQRWKRKIKKSNLKSLEKICKNDVKVIFDEMQDLEDFLCRIDAECYRYAVPVQSKDCIAAINKIYSPDKYYYWERLLRRGSKKFAWFDAVINKVEMYAHSRLDLLDKIHEKEFENWKRNPANQNSLQERRSLVNQRTFLKAQSEAIASMSRLQKANEKRLEEAERRADQAMMEAESAMQRAIGAESAASEASEATRRARDAEERASHLELRLNAAGIQ